MTSQCVVHVGIFRGGLAPLQETDSEREEACAQALAFGDGDAPCCDSADEGSEEEEEDADMCSFESPPSDGWCAAAEACGGSLCNAEECIGMGAGYVPAPIAVPELAFFHLCVAYLWGPRVVRFPPTLALREGLLEARGAQAAAALFHGAVQPADAEAWRLELLTAFIDPDGIPLPLEGNPWVAALSTALRMPLGRCLPVAALLRVTLATAAAAPEDRLRELRAQVGDALGRTCIAIELAVAE